MILTHLVAFSFFAGAGGAAEPQPEPPAALVGGAGSWKKPKQWWRVGEDLIYGTEDQAVRLATPEAPKTEARKAKRKPAPVPLDVPLVEVPEVMLQEVFPSFFREVPLLFDNALLVRMIQRRLDELEDEAIEFLLLH